ncbi:STE3-like pheromone receptor [Melanogaster broomeanus]|nr:STE3-like pheromone receptor [Melanogaster broomeanus]
MPAVPPNSVFSAFSFIGFLLAGTPLPWHLQSWNTGTCMYMIWTSLACLILFVNSIVWNDNVINWAPVWCDISARYIVGASIGVPASALCINRRLYYITKLQSLSYGKEEYIVQGHRFDIFEQIGCYPHTVNTLPAYPLVFIMVYSALTFRRALRQRSRLKEMLHTGCSISAGRYWRLMALLYAIIMDILTDPPIPYISWANIHWGFSAVGQYPSVVWSSAVTTSLETTRWNAVLCAFVIFGFFGWAQGTRDFYRQTFYPSVVVLVSREFLPR